MGGELREGSAQLLLPVLWESTLPGVQQTAAGTFAAVPADRPVAGVDRGFQVDAKEVRDSDGPGDDIGRFERELRSHLVRGQGEPGEVLFELDELTDFLVQVPEDLVDAGCAVLLAVGPVQQFAQLWNGQHLGALVDLGQSRGLALNLRAVADHLAAVGASTRRVLAREHSSYFRRNPISPVRAVFNVIVFPSSDTLKE